MYLRLKTHVLTFMFCILWHIGSSSIDFIISPFMSSKYMGGGGGDAFTRLATIGWAVPCVSPGSENVGLMCVRSAGICRCRLCLAVVFWFWFRKWIRSINWNSLTLIPKLWRISEWRRGEERPVSGFHFPQSTSHSTHSQLATEANNKANWSSSSVDYKTCLINQSVALMWSSQRRTILSSSQINTSDIKLHVDKPAG